MTEETMSPKKKEALERLPKHLHPIYEQLIKEYQSHCIERYGRPFVSYTILADLVTDGWRPTHEPSAKLFQREFE